MFSTASTDDTMAISILTGYTVFRLPDEDNYGNNLGKTDRSEEDRKNKEFLDKCPHRPLSPSSFLAAFVVGNRFLRHPFSLLYASPSLLGAPPRSFGVVGASSSVCGLSGACCCPPVSGFPHPLNSAGAGGSTSSSPFGTSTAVCDFFPWVLTRNLYAFKT